MQTPAHSTIDNQFDQEFFRMQRELIIDAYKAVRLIRIVFANHPKCRGYEVEGILYDGKLRDF